MGLLDTLGHVVGDFIMPANDARELSKPWGTLANEGPSPFGMVTGGAMFLRHAALAAEAQDTNANGYLHNPHWNEVGEAHLAGIEAAGAINPLVSGVIGAGELGVNLLGGAAGLINKDWGFSAASLLGGADHFAHDHPLAAQMVGMPLNLVLPGMGSMIAAEMSMAGPAISAIGGLPGVSSLAHPEDLLIAPPQARPHPSPLPADPTELEHSHATPDGALYQE